MNKFLANIYSFIFYFLLPWRFAGLQIISNGTKSKVKLAKSEKTVLISLTEIK